MYDDRKHSGLMCFESYQTLVPLSYSDQTKLKENTRGVDEVFVMGKEGVKIGHQN